VLEELASAVRTGKVHPRELVTEALSRIERDNPAINAVVALRAEAALADAERHACTGPLAGIPVLIKDLYRAAGLPTTYGSALFADAGPESHNDATVERYVAAGAIVIGKTNSPAFGHMAVTNNAVYGPTRNPWNLAKTPGGSSGGAGAALAAGLVPLASSSDGGGSTRIPASMCGLVGYKPTFGMVGRSGSPRWMTFSSMGATGATVADVVLEASVICGTVAGDLYSAPSAHAPWTPTQPIRVLACRTFRPDIDDVIAEAFHATVEAIANDLKLPIEWIDAPVGQAEARKWAAIAAVELSESLAEFENRAHLFDPGIEMMRAYAAKVSATDYVAAQRHRFAATARLDELLTEGTVIITPVANSAAWPAEGPMANVAGTTVDPGIALNTAELNYTGHPALSVPMGLDHAGVPFGLQVIAPRWRDGYALGLAAQLEEIRPWPHVAPGYAPWPLP
jgi:Asp-tRNA(Asn)/Glu-tRNA(Gln) amidotransferase A subunit family amidase